MDVSATKLGTAANETLEKMESILEECKRKLDEMTNGTSHVMRITPENATVDNRIHCVETDYSDAIRKEKRNVEEDQKCSSKFETVVEMRSNKRKNETGVEENKLNRELPESVGEPISKKFSVEPEIISGNGASILEECKRKPDEKNNATSNLMRIAPESATVDNTIHCVETDYSDAIRKEKRNVEEDQKCSSNFETVVEMRSNKRKNETGVEENKLNREHSESVGEPISKKFSVEPEIISGNGASMADKPFESKNERLAEELKETMKRLGLEDAWVKLRTDSKGALSEIERKSATKEHLAEISRDQKEKKSQSQDENPINDLCALVKSSAPGGTVTKDSVIKTLKDSLEFFGLYQRFQELEESLEVVRRQQKTTEDHELCSKAIDKEIQKLSIRYHPDKVENKSSGEEMSRAQELQSALNATRKVLAILTKMFLEDIDIDHRYGYFANLDISLLGNENEIESRVYAILFKIVLISEIKQLNIIATIRKFLEASRNCVLSYSENNVADFRKYRCLALFYLERCIEGYKKLFTEYEVVEKQCREEKSDIYSLICKMKTDYSRQLKHLEKLFEVSKRALKGTLEIFCSFESLDDYFVFPFVCYINVILMCNAIIQNTEETKLSNFYNFFQFRTDAIEHKGKTFFLADMFYLASFYSGNKKYKSFVQVVLGKISINEEDIKEEFLKKLKELDLENKFKIDDYKVKRYITEELKECLKMKTEFKKNKKEIYKGIETINKSNAEMKDQWNKFMKDNPHIIKKVEEVAIGTSMQNVNLFDIFS